jgi:hypothetical protein
VCVETQHKRFDECRVVMESLLQWATVVTKKTRQQLESSRDNPDKVDLEMRAQHAKVALALWSSYLCVQRLPEERDLKKTMEREGSNTSNFRRGRGDCGMHYCS